MNLALDQLEPRPLPLGILIEMVQRNSNEPSQMVQRNSNELSQMVQRNSNELS